MRRLNLRERLQASGATPEEHERPSRTPGSRPETTPDKGSHAKVRHCRAPQGSEWLFQAMSKDSRSRISAASGPTCGRTGLHGVRIHDPRHTFASRLISGGATLPIVGKLLGLPKRSRRSAIHTCSMIPFGRALTRCAAPETATGFRQRSVRAHCLIDCHRIRAPEH
jgi:hypothetical protein